MALQVLFGFDFLNSRTDLTLISTLNRTNDANHYDVVSGRFTNRQAVKIIGSTDDDTRLTRGRTANANGSVGFWLKMDKIGSGHGASNILILLDGATVHLAVRFTPSTDTVGIYLGGSSLIGSTATFDLDDGNWHHIEWTAVIADSTGGSTALVIDGSTVLNHTSTDTRNGGNASFDGFGILARRADGSNYCNMTMDDLFITDSTTLLGSHRIVPRVPVADEISNWTPSTGTSHSALIDELPFDSADYISHGTASQVDQWHMDDLPLAASGLDIFAIQPSIVCIRPGITAVNVACRIVSGSTTDTGSFVSVVSANAFRICGPYSVDPDTSAAWTESGVAAARMGVLTSGSGTLRVLNAWFDVLMESFEGDDALSPIAQVSGVFTEILTDCPETEKAVVSLVMLEILTNQPTTPTAPVAEPIYVINVGT